MKPLDESTASVPSAKWRECPFDMRLARTPYLVLPKLALQAMPYEWRDRFEAMLAEMDDAGLETPSYIVLRDERPYAWCVHEEEDDPFSRVDRVEVYLSDPWADYRHGDAWALSREAAQPLTGDTDETLG